MRDIAPGFRSATPRHASAVHGVMTQDALEVSDIMLGEPVVDSAEAEVKVEAETGVVESVKPAAKPGHRAGWWVSMVGIGAVTGMLAVGYLKFIDGPSVGVADANSLESARAAAAPKPPSPNMLSGLAVEFAYPGIFDSVSQVKTDTHATEQYNIGSKSDYSRTIAVSVRPMMTYDDDSSYRMRQIKREEYRETNDKMNGDPMVLMTKLDRSEQTMFWIHQGQEVTVSITTNNPKDDVAEIMKTVKSTLRWRK